MKNHVIANMLLWPLPSPHRKGWRPLSSSGWSVKLRGITYEVLGNVMNKSERNIGVIRLNVSQVQPKNVLFYRRKNQDQEKYIQFLISNLFYVIYSVMYQFSFKVSRVWWVFSLSIFINLIGLNVEKNKQST